MIEKFRRFFERPQFTPDQDFATAIAKNDLRSIVKVIGMLPSLDEDIHSYYFGLKGYLYSLAERYHYKPAQYSMTYLQFHDHTLVLPYLPENLQSPANTVASIYLDHTPFTNFNQEYACNIFGNAFINKTRGVSFKFMQVGDEEDITLSVEPFQNKKPSLMERSLDVIRDLQTNIRR